MKFLLSTEPARIFAPLEIAAGGRRSFTSDAASSFHSMRKQPE
jgi:hypothetical protein